MLLYCQLCAKTHTHFIHQEQTRFNQSENCTHAQLLCSRSGVRSRTRPENETESFSLIYKKTTDSLVWLTHTHTHKTGQNACSCDIPRMCVSRGPLVLLLAMTYLYAQTNNSLPCTRMQPHDNMVRYLYRNSHTVCQ